MNELLKKTVSKDCFHTGILTPPPSKQEVPPQNCAGCDDDAVLACSNN